MRKIIVMVLAAGGLFICNPMGASAAPASGGVISETIKENPLVQEARVFCYNRYTGRFLHWGSCGGRRVYRHYYYYHPYYHRHYYHRYYYHRYHRYHRYHYWRRW